MTKPEPMDPEEAAEEISKGKKKQSENKEHSRDRPEIPSSIIFRPIKNNPFKSIAILLLLVISFFLFFHIVPKKAVFPKKTPTFADTIIYPSEYIEKYNQSGPLQRAEMKKGYIYQQLKERGLIFDTKPGKYSFTVPELFKNVVSSEKIDTEISEKKIEVTGVARNIENKKVELHSVSIENHVDCVFPSPVKDSYDLQAGQEIRVSGKYTNFMKLSDCEIK